MDIDTIVEKLVSRYSTNNPYKIAKSMGIFIFYADLGDTFGFYNCASRIKMINISSKIGDIMQKFVCAHELSHAILHPRLNVPYMRRQTLLSIDRTECEANRLATHLLINGIRFDKWMTKECYMKICGIPSEMARFI